jgi:hypothetical protein
MQSDLQQVNPIREIFFNVSQRTPVDTLARRYISSISPNCPARKSISFRTEGSRPRREGNTA